MGFPSLQKWHGITRENDIYSPKPTASLQISEFYNLFHVFQLKLLATPVPLASHLSLKQSRLGLNWFAFVAIFHRKMIPRGQLLLLQSIDIFKFDYK